MKLERKLRIDQRKETSQLDTEPIRAEGEEHQELEVLLLLARIRADTGHQSV